MFTPKQRMLNAYKGIFSDRYPVAPEFWYFFPAKVLGVSMLEFEREIPFWQSLQKVFRKYDTEGWGVIFPKVENEDTTKKIEFGKLTDTQYREKTITCHKGTVFESSKIFDLHEPSWVEKHIADDEEMLKSFIELALSEKNRYDFSEMNNAHTKLLKNQPVFRFIPELVDKYWIS